GRGLVRQRRSLCAERVEQDGRRAGPARPSREATKVSEVADPPALARAQGVELDRPTPHPFGGRSAGLVAQLGPAHAWRPLRRRLAAREVGAPDGSLHQRVGWQLLWRGDYRNVGQDDAAFLLTP